tara:strand:+ start:32 stop:634 length:603 start_codon:yes stop_codon:yes gene_type:complete
MKGWFVTYLLHMRRPLQLTTELGVKTMLAFQLMFLGMLVSSVAHPVLLGLVTVQFGCMALGLSSSRDLGPLTVLDLFNIAAAYALFAVSSARGMTSAELQPLRWRYCLLPAYWVLLALASARAFLQLLIAPHKWEKTPHGIDSRADLADSRYRVEPFFDNLDGWDRRGNVRLVNGPFAPPSAAAPWPFSAPLQDARVHAR